MEINRGALASSGFHVQEGRRRAPREIVHASSERGPAAGRRGPESARDQPQPRYRPHHRARVPGAGAAGGPELAATAGGERDRAGGPPVPERAAGGRLAAAAGLADGAPGPEAEQARDAEAALARVPGRASGRAGLLAVQRPLPP